MRVSQGQLRDGHGCGRGGGRLAPQGLVQPSPFISSALPPMAAPPVGGLAAGPSVQELEPGKGTHY